MKKFLVSILVLSLLFCGCAKVYEGEEGLIEKAREEIPLSDIENIEVELMAGIENGYEEIFWFKTGNEYQHNRYFPIGFKNKGGDKYEFVKIYDSMERGTDIGVLNHNGDYIFFINNSDCKKILINDDEIDVESIPFVYKCDNFSGKYEFLNKDGVKIE